MTTHTSGLQDDGGDAALPYAEFLTTIGVYIERAHGSDVLVQQIAGGCLVVFRTATEQQTVTFDARELAQVRWELAALEPPVAPAPRRWGRLGRLL